MAPNYDDKEIWFGTSTTSLLLSRLIRFFTRQKTSHAWISFWDETLNRRLVMEEESFGLYITDWKRWCHKEPGKKLWAFEYNKSLSVGLIFIASFLGTKYDYKALFYNFLVSIFGKWAKKKFNTKNRFICSELLVRLFQYEKLDKSEDLDPDYTIPGDILKYMETINGFTRIKTPYDG